MSRLGLGVFAAFALLLADCGGSPQPTGMGVPMALVIPARIASAVSKVQILFVPSDQVGCAAYNGAAQGCYLSNGFGTGKLVQVIVRRGLTAPVGYQ